MGKILVEPINPSSGGGSVNPTTGIVPVNQFGTFQDSVIQSTINLGNGVFGQFDDSGQIIQLVTGSNTIVMDETITEISINSNQINVTGNTGIGLFGGVDIHNHLSNSLLRFLSNGASDPALKANTTTLEVKNGNDSQYLDFKARNIESTSAIKTGLNFVLSVYGSLGASADGTFTLLNNAGTSFNRLCFGQANASFPAIKQSGATILIRLGDDSADANLNAKDLTASGKVYSSADFQITGKSNISSLVDSNVTLYNAGKTAFNILQFGGINSSFPGLKRSGTELQSKLADDSNFAPFRTGNLFVEGGNISANNGNLNIYAGSVQSNSILYGNLNGLAMGKNNVAPVNSAQFEMVSTTRGFLPPRMSQAQRTAISSPAVGLIVFQNDAGNEGLYVYKTAGWTLIV